MRLCLFLYLQGCLKFLLKVVSFVQSVLWLYSVCSSLCKLYKFINRILKKNCFDTLLTSGVTFNCSLVIHAYCFQTVFYGEKTLFYNVIFNCCVSIFKFRIENKKPVYIYGKYTITAISLRMFCCSLAWVCNGRFRMMGLCFSLAYCRLMWNQIPLLKSPYPSIFKIERGLYYNMDVRC